MNSLLLFFFVSCMLLLDLQKLSPKYKFYSFYKILFKIYISQTLNSCFEKRFKRKVAIGLKENNFQDKSTDGKQFYIKCLI